MNHFHLGETEQARQLVMSFHYSHRWPSNVQVVGTWHEDGGLFGDSGEAVAACVFSAPAARWSQPVLELSRLVRREGVNVSLSGLVATSAKWAHRKGWPLLVSFADSTQGHHGGIYQACSWAYAGRRSARMDGCTVNGHVIPGRTLNHLYGTQSVAKLADLGIEAHPHFDTGKHLYWKAHGKSGRRMADALGLAATPYPKPNNAAGGVAA